MNHEHGHHQDSGGRLPWKWILVAFVAIAAYFLIAEHRAHLSGYLNYLPWLLLLACPLLHVFMHGSHGGHGHTPDRADAEDRKQR